MLAGDPEGTRATRAIVGWALAMLFAWMAIGCAVSGHVG